MSTTHALLTFLDETGSTQDDAKGLAHSGAPHGAAVCARRQHDARGRRGRAFAAAHDGVWLSVIVRPAPPLPARVAPRLSLCVGALVHDALAARGVSTFLKWPNDLLVPHETNAPRLGPFRKVGGVLVEALELNADGLAAVVVGVGLNLAMPNDPGLADIAAPLPFVGDIGALAEVTRAAVAASAEHARDAAAFREVLATATARSATLGRRVVVDDVWGRAVGLTDEGGLLVERDDGGRVTVTFGDVGVLG